MDINVGLIGCGYWGKNLIRNFMETENCWLSAICDTNKGLLEKFNKRYPSLSTHTDYKAIIDSKEINAVAVVTPVHQHYRLAKEALLADKHVLVEKPLAASVAEAKELVALAEEKNKVLMVDHTFLYTGAIRKMKGLIDAGEIGDILYYDSVRVNLGLFQEDINVIWDLAPHDLSIMDYLLRERPVSVMAVGSAHVKEGIENIGYLILNFDSNLIAHFHFNWLSPVKIRLTLICGSEKMITYDDLVPGESLKVYDRKVEVMDSDEAHDKLLYDYRVGDMWAPKVELMEALRLVCGEFVNSILEQRAPLTDGESGLRIVRILEAAQRSIKNNGVEVKL
ncbi:MAG: Gfo/Idh/MocA family oxidoreductase [Candidatus Omnitrophica bacterium]|nr:Gfo/Idh/MocA family oxidoreductase [Candidatus Omnitrophota bacterium]